MAYFSKPGYDWNPLRRYRNAACPCGSKLKIKRCHGRLDCLPEKDVALAKAYLRQLSAAGIISGRKGHIDG